MKLYKTAVSFPDSTLPVITYQGSQTEVAKARKKAKEQGGYGIETYTIEVPTSKDGLLKWLNENA